MLALLQKLVLARLAETIVDDLVIPVVKELFPDLLCKEKECEVREKLVEKVKKGA